MKWMNSHELLEPSMNPYSVLDTPHMENRQFIKTWNEVYSDPNKARIKNYKMQIQYLQTRINQGVLDKDSISNFEEKDAILQKRIDLYLETKDIVSKLYKSKYSKSEKIGKIKNIQFEMTQKYQKDSKEFLTKQVLRKTNKELEKTRDNIIADDKMMDQLKKEMATKMKPTLMDELTRRLGDFGIMKLLEMYKTQNMELLDPSLQKK